MRLIFIDKPYQDEKTVNPQLIDGKTYHWVVEDEMAKLGETFQQWWVRKQEYAKTHAKLQHAAGIFFYDAQPCGPIPDLHRLSTGLIVRYMWFFEN